MQACQQTHARRLSVSFHVPVVRPETGLGSDPVRAVHAGEAVVVTDASHHATCSRARTFWHLDKDEVAPGIDRTGRLVPRYRGACSINHSAQVAVVDSSQ